MARAQQQKAQMWLFFGASLHSCRGYSPGSLYATLDKGLEKGMVENPANWPCQAMVSRVYLVFTLLRYASTMPS